MSYILKPENIAYLIIHCSDSTWGDVAVINDWHRQRGFDHEHDEWLQSIADCQEGKIPL